MLYPAFHHPPSIDAAQVSRRAEEAQVRAAVLAEQKGKNGPKGPSQELLQMIVELKRHNPRFGCPRVALIVLKTLSVTIRIIGFAVQASNVDGGGAILRPRGLLSHEPHRRDNTWFRHAEPARRIDGGFYKACNRAEATRVGSLQLTGAPAASAGRMSPGRRELR